jgi:hypothetical protein
MTWLLLIYINGMTIQLNPTYATEAQCRYAGGVMEAEQRTHSNLKELVWDCKRSK